MIICDKKLNILLLGGAKRVSMARMLLDAARAMGFECNIFSYELEPEVPIALVGKVIVGMRWNDEALLDHLHATVRKYDINIMIPFVDKAVVVAARYRSRFSDIWAPVGSASVSESMFDKIEADRIFRSLDLPVPDAYMRGRPEFPIIAKPRYGSASKGIEIITTPKKFRDYLTEPRTHLLQSYIEHREEYTVDCYVAMNGAIKVVSPRRRLEVSGGEVTSTVTVDYPEMVALTRRLIDGVGLRGAVTVQFLKDLTTGRLYIMEVNPRLGGGAVCTVHAGGNIPAYMLAEATGTDLEADPPLRPSTFITRYPQEVVFYDTAR